MDTKPPPIDSLPDGRATGPADDRTVAVPSRAATAAGVVVLLAYLALLIVRWLNVNSNDVTWLRLDEVMSGLEALAFGAAGTLFGTTIQRQITRKAEEQAGQATREAITQRERADSYAREAEKGRALLNLVRTRAGLAKARPGGQVRAGGVQRPEVREFIELLEFANQYEAER